MKYLLFIVLNLAIILAYADFDDKGKLNIEKMQNNLGKVQGLLRKLDDTSDESDDDEELSEDESSGSEEDNLPKNETEPTNTKTPTGNRRSLVQLLGFNSFEAKREAPTITFRTFFTYINVRPARYVIIYIFIRARRGLRSLQEERTTEPANCTIDENDKDKLDGGNIRYNCEAPKSTDTVVENVTVINATFGESDYQLNSDVINFSEEAVLEGTELFKQTQVVNKIYQLNKGKVTSYSDYFIITGEINDQDNDFSSKYGTSPLYVKVVDTSTDPSTYHNVSCVVESKEIKNYRLRCTPDPDAGVKGNLFLSSVTDSNQNAISLNITEGSDYINYVKNSTEPTTNINRGIAPYRKSSSGLSGGAIAGIVIACVVVLIIASLVAIMMKKSAVSAAPFQTQTPSIVGLRSVDNMSQ